jgi:hypothetical protein
VLRGGLPQVRPLGLRHRRRGRHIDGPGGSVTAHKQHQPAGYPHHERVDEAGEHERRAKTAAQTLRRVWHRTPSGYWTTDARQQAHERASST